MSSPEDFDACFSACAIENKTRTIFLLAKEPL